MGHKSERRYKPNLLCVVPPFNTNCPPAGAAYLMGYLKANGCAEFDFLDLRLGVPEAYSPTFTYSGAFGEAYVMDIPDLPLVLQLLRTVEEGQFPTSFRNPLFDRYCIERTISPAYLESYLMGICRYLAHVFDQIPVIDFIGFSTWTTNYFTTLLACAYLKRRSRPPVVIAGGPQVTASPASAKLALASGLVDVVALGEGEQTLLAVYDHFANGHGVPRNLPGTMTRDASGTDFFREERPLMRVPAIPTPSFSEMHLEAYQTESGYRTLPMQLSRGCTDKCEFCSEWVFWRSFRPDTPEHAVAQIKELQERYGANFIIFSDSLLNGVPKRLVAFAEEMIRENVQIKWAGFMRAQMDRDTAELIARAGCNDVFVGIESFSDETLELMNKRRTKAQNIESVEAFLGAGIGVTGGFVPGFPGDSRTSFLRSAMVLQELQTKYPGLLEIHEEPFLVQPNAPIYFKLEEMGLKGIPWDEEYLQIAPEYVNTTSQVFCTVEGASQGIERLGRLAIVKTIKTDTPSSGAHSFQDGNEEGLGIHEFSFYIKYGEWCIAQKKAIAGHVYSLLLNSKERQELEELQQNYSVVDLHEDPLSTMLARFERAHVVCPPRKGLRMVRSLYDRNNLAGCRLTLSPFVVVRAIGGRQRRQGLIVNFVSDRMFRCSAKDLELLELLAAKPRQERELIPSWLQGGRTVSELRKRIQALKEDGIIIICDRLRDTSNASPSQPAEANAVHDEHRPDDIVELALP